jgi:SNF2 family DNA or RNA helicase
MLPHETLSTLRRVKGMRFDYENAIMLFPLTEHDNLQVALAAIRIIVEPLPRSVIAAVQLSHKRDNPSRIVDYDNPSSSEEPIDVQKALEEKAEATDKVLSTKINEKLLKALAPFQREGVLFTVNNNGRALIADEMGLGKSSSTRI